MKTRTAFVYSKLFYILLVLSVFFQMRGWSTPFLKEKAIIPIGGKPVQMQIDGDQDYAYIIDYEKRNIKVVDLRSFEKVLTLAQSSYPVYTAFSDDYAIVSDFWGHKVDFYIRGTSLLDFSVPTPRGPGYAIYHQGLVYVTTQLEHQLIVIDPDRKAIAQSFALIGRVPRFSIFDSLIILPYYDNYHTWSRDFELEHSIHLMNLRTLHRWNIDGISKKPLHILEIEPGIYALSGYLDQGIWLARWGSETVLPLAQWRGHTHIMDMVLFKDDVVVPSMSNDHLFFVSMQTGNLESVGSATGILSLVNYEDRLLFALSNFHNLLQIYDPFRVLVEEHEVGDYPIAMKSHGDLLLVLSMDDADLRVFQILAGEEIEGQ